MLVFGRKVGEEVMIGDDIIVKVVSLRGGRISLGFKAPPEVPINRREIYERLRLQQAFACPDVADVVRDPQPV